MVICDTGGAAVVVVVAGGAVVVVVAGGAVVVVVAGGAVVVVVGALVGTEVDVRSPVNEMGQGWLFPASRLSWPVPVMALPPLLSVIVMSSIISFVGCTRMR
jgi:hypothetical protein